MRTVFYLFMGMMTGIVIIGIEFICITAVIKVRDRFQRMDEMERELERLKWRQRIMEGRLRDWSRMKPGMEEVLRLHGILF